jgi:GT2 family glycosyltransferase
MTGEILVVVPTYGQFDYARRTVCSLLKYTPDSGRAPKYIIIDDASEEWASIDWTSWPEAECRKLRFDEHAGLTRSWNAGLRIAVELSVRYTVCTNSDVLFSRNWYEPLIEALETDYDLVGPVTNAPGHAPWQSVTPFCHPFQPHLDDDSVQIDQVTSAIHKLAIGAIEAPINGFFMMAKTETWWRGAFDSENVFNPAFPLVGNEVELQRRWSLIGLRTGFVPRSYIFHYRSISRPDGLRGALGRGAYRRCN